jgi:hypothetical protein
MLGGNISYGKKFAENRKGVGRFGNFALQLVRLKTIVRRKVMYFGVAQDWAQRQPVAGTMMNPPTP